MTAPPPIALSVEYIKEDMKNISQKVLEKHLIGRKYNQDLVKIFGDNIISEIHTLLEKKYPQYRYCIAFYMSDLTSYVSNDKCIYYTKTDIVTLTSYYTNDFYSEIRLIAYKNKLPLKNFLDNINDSDMVMNINNKMSSILRGKKFVFESFQDIIANVCNEINDILLARKDRPCSYHIGYINQLPTKGVYFSYKFFNLEFSPIIFVYSNDSFVCKVYLFIVNN